MTNVEKTIGPWRVKKKSEPFENPWIKIVDHEVIHPDGSPGEYGVVRFKNLAIGILPIDDDGSVWLVGQHRFPHDRYSWELPEGGGALDVPPLESAKRELSEETGMTAREWARFSSFDISNSVTDERALCYFAWSLEQGAAAPEASEALTIKRVPFCDLFEMVMSGEITDSLTIVMVLMAFSKALRGEAPEPISRHILAAQSRK
jgi:ADP-ribose diphosphatase